MKTWLAILFTIGLLAACILVSVLTGFEIVRIMVVGTALWAAIDSWKIQFWKIQFTKYKTSGPFILFLGVCALWILFFPWYLSMRYKIRADKAALKENPAMIPPLSEA